MSPRAMEDVGGPVAIGGDAEQEQPGVAPPRVRLRRGDHPKPLVVLSARPQAHRPRELERLRAAASDAGESAEVERPRTRGECRGQERPCPWVGCRYHLYLDVEPSTGQIKLNRPDLEPWELEVTCALDVAEGASSDVEQLTVDGRTRPFQDARFHRTLDEIRGLLNITREGVRQIEKRALATLRRPRRVS